MGDELQIRVQASDGPGLYFHVPRDGEPMVVRADLLERETMANALLSNREIGLLRALLKVALVEIDNVGD